MCDCCESEDGHKLGCLATAADQQEAARLFQEGRMDCERFWSLGPMGDEPSYLLGWRSALAPQPSAEDLARFDSEAPLTTIAYVAKYSLAIAA
jgi:hypothetical protein